MRPLTIEAMVACALGLAGAPALAAGAPETIAVVAGANFGSEAVKFRDKEPPEQRPMSGG